MSVSGAFARTSARLARKDVPVAMQNWWKNIKPVEGEITQHLANNEQDIIVPWLKTWPKKVVDRVPVYIWPFGTAVLIYSVASLAESIDQAEDYAHRY